MSSVTNERTKETLTPWGQLANGVVSHAAMLVPMTPVMNKATCDMTSTTAVKTPFPRNPWSGIAAANLSVLPPQAASFFVYGLFARYIAKGEKMTDNEKLQASILAGSAGAPLASMFERAQVFRVLYKLKFFPAMKEIKAAEGYRGYFKGLSPTLWREIEYALAVLYARKQIAKGLEGRVKNKTVREVAGSVLAGGIAGFVSSPLDIVNKRMKKDLQGSHSACKTAWKIITEEEVDGKILKVFKPINLFRGAGWRTLLVGGAVFCVGLSMDRFPKYLPSSFHKNNNRPA